MPKSGHITLTSVAIVYGRELLRSSTDTYFISQVGAEVVEALLEEAAENDENATAAIEKQEPTFHLQVYNYAFKYKYCIVIFRAM